VTGGASEQRAPGLPPRGAFLLGMPRSGTTLLRALLDGHPDVFVAPWETKAVDWCRQPDPVAGLLTDTRYAREFPRQSPEGAAFEAAVRRRVPGPRDPAAAVEAVVEALLELDPPAQPPGLWIEKTPKHLAIVPELARLRPGARFLCLLRDPRAVLASHAKRWDKTGRGQQRRLAQKWALAEELARRFEHSVPGFATVRYRDLVHEPEATTRRVCEHLGVAWQKTLLTPSSRGDPWKGPRGQTGISTSAVDAWKGELAPGRVRLIESVLGERMARRGYACVTGARGGVGRWWSEREVRREVVGVR